MCIAKIRRYLSVLLSVALLFTVLQPMSLTAETSGIDGYVTDGLAAFYSGSYNTRHGADADSTVWEDLVGGYDVTVEHTLKNYFTGSAYHVDRSEFCFPSGILEIVNGSSFTVELTLGDFETISGNTYATLLNSTANDNFALFWRASGDYLEFKSSTNSRPKVSGGQDLFRDSTVSLCFTKGESCRVYVDGYLISEVAVSSTVNAKGVLKFGHASSGKTHIADYEGIRFYTRALTEAEVIQNASADGHYDPDRILPKDYAQVQQPSTKIIGDLTFSEFVETKAELTAALSAEVKAANLIFYVNASLEVTDASGNNAYATVATVYDALNGGFIPTFSVKDSATVAALCDFLRENLISDCFILSSDLSLLKQARENYDAVRAVADASEAFTDNVTEEQLIALRKEANASGCKVVILPSRFVTAENITYLNSRAMTVWLQTDGVDTDAEALSLALSSAYGIVSRDTARIYQACETYLAENTLTRAPLNVAHRGLHTEHPENTLEAMVAAEEAGADLLEIDLWLTADNEIAVCHNSTTGSLYNRNMTVENSTMKRLKSIYIEQNGRQYFMPSLREIFTAFQSSDIGFLLEIKSSDTEIVAVLKNLIEEFDLYDRCTVITFNRTGMFEELQKTFPEMPVGYLIDNAGLSTSVEDSVQAIQTLIQPTNTFFDPNYSGYTAAHVRASAQRGFATWVWTVDNADSIFRYLLQGCAGITTNYCTLLQNYPRALQTALSSGIEIPVGQVTEIPVQALLYSGALRDVPNAEITVLSGDAHVEDGGLVADASGEITFLISYTVDLGTNRESYTLYVQPITVTAVSDEQRCDLNGDGALNDADAALLYQILSGSVGKDTAVRDTDLYADGVTGMKDLTALLHRLSDEAGSKK